LLPIVAVGTIPGQSAAMRAAWKDIASWVMLVSGITPLMI